MDGVHRLFRMGSVMHGVLVCDASALMLLACLGSQTEFCYSIHPAISITPWPRIRFLESGGASSSTSSLPAAGAGASGSTSSPHPGSRSAESGSTGSAASAPGPGAPPTASAPFRPQRSVLFGAWRGGGGVQSQREGGAAAAASGAPSSRGGSGGRRVATARAAAPVAAATAADRPAAGTAASGGGDGGGREEQKYRDMVMTEIMDKGPKVSRGAVWIRCEPGVDQV